MSAPPKSVAANGTAEAPPNETTASVAHTRSRWLVGWTKLLVAFAVGAATLTVTIFQLHDRLWPPVTVYGGEVVSADIVQLDVSYQRYVYAHKGLFVDWNKTLSEAGNKLVDRGAVVNVVVRLQGLRGRDCRVTSTVYRVPLRRVDKPHEALKQCTAHVQDGDQGGWPAWVELPRKRGRYFIRFDLYDDELLIGPGKTTQVFAWNGGS